MSHTLTLNTARANVYTTLVASPIQPHTPAPFPALTHGETVPLTLRLITAAGIDDPRSGAPAYTPRITLTQPDPRPTGGTFTLTTPAGTLTAAYDIGSEPLQTALNTLLDPPVTVQKFAHGEYVINWTTAGTQTRITASAADIQPESNAATQRLITGDAATREEQLIRITAAPLVQTTNPTPTANGWTMTLDATPAKLLRALVAARGDLQANYTIDLTGPDNAVEIISQGPLHLTRP